MAGLVLSLLSLAAALALVTLSGATIAALFSVALVAAPLWLKIAGPARVVLRYFERLATHSGTFRALAGLRIWFFKGLSRSSAGGLGFRRSGDLLSSLVSDVEALDGLYLRILVPLVGAALVIPAVGTATGRLSIGLGVVTAVLFAAAAFVLPILAAGRSMRAGAQLAQATSGLRVAALDALSGLRGGAGLWRRGAHGSAGGGRGRHADRCASGAGAQ